MNYAELHCHTHYSFLNGTSSPAELTERAVQLGLTGMALTDDNGLYGVIPFIKKCKELDLTSIVGALIAVEPNDKILLLCENLTGYHNLSRLITRAQENQPKGQSLASLNDVSELSDGIICLVGGKEGNISTLLKNQEMSAAKIQLDVYRQIFGHDYTFVELTNNLQPGDSRLCQQLYKLALGFSLPCVATNNVRYATHDGAKLYDVLRCIKHKVKIDQSDGIRPKNHQHYLKSPQEMTALFSHNPQALQNTQSIVERCHFELDFSQHRLPDFPVPTGHSTDSYLVMLCKALLHKKYDAVTTEIRTRLHEELALIERLRLSGYFLVVWDIVAFARAQSIPIQGRGSAANSLVAYLLDITTVDPIAHQLFFGRFLNENKTTIPDIDLDIAASRNSALADREDVIQYVYQKYGFEYVALTCTFTTYGAKGAIREVGKVFGIPNHLLERMSRLTNGQNVDAAFKKIDESKKFRSYTNRLIWRHFHEHVEAIIGIPRHLSMHPGGMVIASCKLPPLVPLEPARMEGRRVCQWDKDMIEDAGLIKVDLLGLGMLAVIRETINLVAETSRIELDYTDIPPDDPAVYDMLAVADTLGVFQLESRVQCQSLPRTQPRNLIELAIQLAIIRPGPIQGNMVEPYIARKRGKELVHYLHPKLEPILKETLGVILFQEQVLQVACRIADYTAGEAENLRRELDRKRGDKGIAQMCNAFVTRAIQNGVPERNANQIFECIKSFAAYGFCKSHALSFAHLAYQSAWMKHHYPVEFLCAVLSNQPVGFYPPEVLINDAMRHDIEILPVDINRSKIRCTIETNVHGKSKIRMNLLCIKGISLQKAKTIEVTRSSGFFLSLKDFIQRTNIDCNCIEHLIGAGACDNFNLSRVELLWQLWIIDRWREDNLVIKPEFKLPPLPEPDVWNRLGQEYDAQGFSTHIHPMQLLRTKLRSKVQRRDALEDLRDGTIIWVAGIVISMQRPPTANGFAFLSLEDETGLINIVISPKVYNQYQSVFRLAPFVCVHGVLQHREGVINVRAKSFEQLRSE